MRSLTRFAVPAVLVSALVASAGPATAAGTPDVHSANMKHIGSAGNPGTTNSDLAFWGNLLYEGSYTGFRILDISNPRDPRGSFQFGFAAFTWIEMKRLPDARFAIFPRSSSAISVSDVRV